MIKNYYEILGVEKSAPPSRVYAAYRKRALECHPDVNSDPHAHEQFLEVNEAYEVLKNPLRRKKYDWLHHLEFEGVDAGPGREGERGRQSTERRVRRSAERGRTKGARREQRPAGSVREAAGAFRLFLEFLDFIFSIINLLSIP